MATRNQDSIINNDQVWANEPTSIKAAPSGFTQNEGWPEIYQKDVDTQAGIPPAMSTFNYYFNKMSSVCNAVTNFGSNLPYDQSISYEKSAVAISVNDKRYISNKETTNVTNIESSIDWDRLSDTTINSDNQLVAVDENGVNRVIANLNPISAPTVLEFKHDKGFFEYSNTTTPGQVLNIQLPDVTAVNDDFKCDIILYEPEYGIVFNGFPLNTPIGGQTRQYFKRDGFNHETYPIRTTTNSNIKLKLKYLSEAEGFILSGADGATETVQGLTTYSTMKGVLDGTNPSSAITPAILRDYTESYPWGGVFNATTFPSVLDVGQSTITASSRGILTINADVKLVSGGESQVVFSIPNSTIERTIYLNSQSPSTANKNISFSIMVDGSATYDMGINVVGTGTQSLTLEYTGVFTGYLN